MTPSDEVELLKLVKENNKMLHKMRRSQVWNRVFKVLYLVIILGVTFGAYYLIQPFLENVLGTYQGLLDETGGVEQIGTSLPDIRKLFGGSGSE